MKTIDTISDRGDQIVYAAQVLIAMVKSCEGERRSVKSELSLEVDLTGGGKETWLITIERTASTH